MTPQHQRHGLPRPRAWSRRRTWVVVSAGAVPGAEAVMFPAGLVTDGKRIGTPGNTSALNPLKS